MVDFGHKFIAREIRAGFLSPIHSLKFFSSHKLLLVSGLAPHILGFCGHLWISFSYIMPFIQIQIEKFTGNPLSALSSKLFAASFVLLSFIGYSFLAAPLVNALASPIFDIHAEKAYAAFKSENAPPAKSGNFFKSFVSECCKFVFIFSVFILSFFVPFAAPLGFLASIWFFGWDIIDRTLSLQNFSFRDRLIFGLKHCVTCISLGVWVYIPFAGTLLAFVFAAAGGIAVAHLNRE